MADGKNYTSEAQAQDAGLDTSQKGYFPGTNVALGTADQTSKVIYNPQGSSLNAAAQAAGFGSASEARAAGYSFVDTDYKTPSIVTSEKAKTQTDSNIKDMNAMAEQLGQTPEKTATDDMQSKVDKYMAESPQAKAVADAIAQIESTIKNRTSQVDQYEATMAENQKGIMEGIKASYARRIEEAKVFNQNVLGGTQLRGVRTGRQRYAREMQADIVSKEEKAGLDRIGSIESQMQQELMAAQQAFDTNNLKLLSQKTELLTNLYNQKRQAAIDLATMASNYETQLRERARFNMEMINFEDEQAQKIGMMLAPTLLETDAEGNLMMPDDTKLNDIAEQYGIDTLILKSSLNTQIGEIEKMNREAQKEYFETLKLQQEVANYGMSDTQQEYEYAVKNYGYTGTVFDYMQDKETSSLSSYDILKKQLEIQNLQKAGQNFDTFTANGQTYVKYDDGTVVPFTQLFPAEVDTEAVGTALDKINSIDKLLNHKGLPEAVGASMFSRGWLTQSSLEVLLGSADKKAFIGSVEQLISQETLDTLINLKKAGGTLGALSDQERVMLKNAASAIGNFAIEKNGKVVGYDIDQNTFKKELNRLKTLATKAYKEAAGIKYMSYDELAKDIPESELLNKYDDQLLKGNTIEETRNNILQFYNQQSFNSVGGDTEKATISMATSIPNGTKGGQCGRFVNSLTGLGLGDSYQSKMAKMDKSIKTPQPGMVFVMPLKGELSKYGHTGIILAINNGIATVKDSNWNKDEKIKTHQIPVSKMTGFTYA